MVPLGFLTRMRGGCTPSTTEQEFWDGDVPWVTPKDMKCVEISDSIDHVTEEALARTTLEFVERDAILVVVRGMILAHSFPVAIARCRVTINQDMKALICSPRLLPRFALWTLIGFADVLVSLTDESAHGTRKLDASTLAHFPIALPDISTQHQIASYLDRETAKIDRLIAKKRELLELLEEKRQALISRCVTKGLPPEAARAAGLDPHPQMKDSGIDWLGDVPAHWEVTNIRHAFFNLDSRRIPVAAELRASLEKTYPYYGASGIIDYVDDYIFDEPLILVAEDGANLLSRSTPLAFLATGKYWVNNHAHILRPKDGELHYWVHVLQTIDYTPLVTGAAQPKLTSDRLNSIGLPKPPVGEQRAIAQFLGVRTGRIGKIAETVEAAIERLQEYRTALITAAVTGKIDVRDQNPDADDPDTVEPEPLAETH